jgi:hypothetical protein
LLGVLRDLVAGVVVSTHCRRVVSLRTPSLKHHQIISHRVSNCGQRRAQQQLKWIGPIWVVVVCQVCYQVLQVLCCQVCDHTLLCSREHAKELLRAYLQQSSRCGCRDKKERLHYVQSKHAMAILTPGSQLCGGRTNYGKKPSKQS